MTHEEMKAIVCGVILYFVVGGFAANAAAEINDVDTDECTVIFFLYPLVLLFLIGRSFYRCFRKHII